MGFLKHNFLCHAFIDWKNVKRWSRWFFKKNRA